MKEKIDIKRAKEDLTYFINNVLSVNATHKIDLRLQKKIIVNLAKKHKPLSIVIHKRGMGILLYENVKKEIDKLKLPIKVVCE